VLRWPQRDCLKAGRLLDARRLRHHPPGRLQAASTNERSLEERLAATQEELQDVSSTCRVRMRWLDAAAADSARRVEQLFRCLQGAAPLEVRGRAGAVWGPAVRLAVLHGDMLGAAGCVACCVRAVHVGWTHWLLSMCLGNSS
jgi:hypothetical protein